MTCDHVTDAGAAASWHCERVARRRVRNETTLLSGAASRPTPADSAVDAAVPQQRSNSAGTRAACAHAQMTGARRQRRRAH